MSTVTGTSGNDTITATMNGESIDGQGGSDVLSSAAFTGVTLDNRNGSGSSFTAGGDSGVTIIGGNGGNDTMSVAGTGSGAFDFLDAQQGGHDSITGGSSNVKVWTHGDVATINPVGQDTITFGDGNDTITTGGENGTGHNLVTLGNGNDVVDGFYSTGDSINVGNGDNVIYPGLGGGHTINIAGGSHSLVMAIGSASGNTENIAAGIGSDTVNNGEGSSVINSNGNTLSYYTDVTLGHDTLNAGVNMASGTTGHDTVGYNYSPDAVTLNLTDAGGNSTIGLHTLTITGTGNVTQFNLTPHGNDSVAITGHNSYFIESGGSGNDIFSASTSTGNETLYGGSGNDYITTGTGSNIVDGQGGTNTINSNGYDLVYSGTGGNNTINVDNGANTTLDYNYAHTTGGVIVNLPGGAAASASLGTGAFSDTINVASGGLIGTVIGSHGNDNIIGYNAGGQLLSGDGAGNDIITHPGIFPTSDVTTSSGGAVVQAGTDGIDPAPIFGSGGTTATYYAPQGSGIPFGSITFAAGAYIADGAYYVASSTESIIHMPTTMGAGNNGVVGLTINFSAVSYGEGGYATLLALGATASGGQVAVASDNFSPTTSAAGVHFTFAASSHVDEVVLWPVWGSANTTAAYSLGSETLTFANPINTAGDTLNGSGSGNDSLYAGAAPDVLIGGTGNDLFSFKGGVIGQAVINNFHTGDQIEIAAPTRVSSTIISGITSDGHGNAIINLPGGASIEVAGAATHTFTASDFLFT